MQYLLLIYGNENAWGKMSQAEQDQLMKEYTDFTESIAKSGHLRGGNELEVGFERDGEQFKNVTLTGPADFVFDGTIEL